MVHGIVSFYNTFFAQSRQDRECLLFMGNFLIIISHYFIKLRNFLSVDFVTKICK